MTTKTYRPITPGRRQLIHSGKEELSKPTKNKPHKAFLSKQKRSSGRNNQGHLTSTARGGGHKRRYRQIDFKRVKDDIPAKILSVEYDPNRSAHIALIAYQDGEKRYVLAHKGANVGDMVHSGPNAPLRNGNTLPMMNMPIGAVIHNVEITPGRGGQLIRSAGLSAQLMARSAGYVTLKMPSGEVRMVRETCRATMGQVSNEEHNLSVTGKAGRARWLGWRPRSRGVVTNPVDGTMGGGEGKHKGHVPRSRTAVPSKGFKTRSKRKSTRLIVKDRRK
jgi:large subunit ribosomal protein L2